jgi:hypothetical protein
VIPSLPFLQNLEVSLQAQEAAGFLVSKLPKKAVICATSSRSGLSGLLLTQFCPACFLGLRYLLPCSGSKLPPFCRLPSRTPTQPPKRSDRFLQTGNFFLCAASRRSQAFDYLSQVHHAPPRFGNGVRRAEHYTAKNTTGHLSLSRLLASSLTRIISIQTKNPSHTAFCGISVALRELKAVSRLRWRGGQTARAWRRVRDPDTGSPFPGNIISPADRIDPNAALLLQKYYLLPDRPGQPNFVFTSNAASNWRKELARVDHHISDRVTFTGRFAHDFWAEHQSIFKPSPSAFPTVPGLFAKPGFNAAARLQMVLSPTTINAFTAGFSRNNIQESPDAPRTGLTIPEVLPGNFFNAIPDINLAQGFGSVGIGGAFSNVNNVLTYRDDLTHVRGSHSLEFGFQALRIQKFDFGSNIDHGAFTFDGSFTGMLSPICCWGEPFSTTRTARPPTLTCLRMRTNFTARMIGR